MLFYCAFFWQATKQRLFRLFKGGRHKSFFCVCQGHKKVKLFQRWKDKNTFSKIVVAFKEVRLIFSIINNEKCCLGCFWILSISEWSVELSDEQFVGSAQIVSDGKSQSQIRVLQVSVHIVDDVLFIDGHLKTENI